jgi:photosystem II stability/assembly factor-like uncharacterized protein
MKPSTVFLLILGCLDSTAVAQEWHWQNPLPQGNSLYAVQVVDQNTVVCVGEVGTFLKSTDTGANWTISHYIAGISHALFGISFADANIGTAVGADGTILRTSDGGLSWSIQNSTTTQSLSDVTFPDPNTGTAVGSLGTILHTVDGGQSWVDQSIGGTISLTGVSFINATVGWAVGSGGTIVHTTDAGTSWVSQSSGSTVTLEDIFFTDASIGTTVGGGGTILRTTSGGTTWVSQPSGTTLNLNGVSFVDENIGVAVTGSSAVFRTTNGGMTWTNVAPGGDDHTLYDVSLHPTNIGFIAGEDGAIYQSLNAGNTWQELSSGSTISVSGLTFLDTATGVAVGSGLVFRTSDGGANWMTQTATGLLQSVWFSDADNGTAVGLGGNSGVILRTTDRGITWNLLPPPGGNLYAVHYADSANGTAVGDRIIVRTSDAGITWETQLFGTIPPMGGVHMIDESTAVAVGGTGFPPGNPTVLRTSDGGATWQTIATPATGALNAIDLINGSTGVAVGNGGTIIRTTDRGLTWSLHSSNTTNSLQSVRFNPAGTEGIAVGSFGTILRTTDAGITWTNELSSTLNSLHCVSPTGYTGWTIGGDEGGILHRASSVSSFPVVTVDIEIDSLNMVVPAEGDTFAYSMTFTNLTSISQTVDVWTKVLRPIGNPIDPLYGPETLTFDPFEVIVIDTATVGVPFDGRSGEYSLIAFVGTYQVDTLHTDTTMFVKLPVVPCEDISQFQARCRPGGTIQARIILTDNSYTGDRVEFTIDSVAYEATVSQNRRALLSLPGFAPGSHTVGLTEPPGCFDPITVTCPAGLGREEDEWEEEIGSQSQKSIPPVLALYDSYPNPFNPTTIIRYDLPTDSRVSLKVYDLLGREVVTLSDGVETAGYHQVIFNASELATGIYFYRLTAGSFTDVKRLVVVK